MIKEPNKESALPNPLQGLSSVGSLGSAAHTEGGHMGQALVTYSQLAPPKMLEI